MDKTLLKSKTFWFGIIMAVAPLFPSVDGLLKSNPTLLTSIAAAITVFLRMKTNKAISGVV